ncbi:MAG: YgeY family selenium metabolism-linked hydrolase [Candidatus Accumulibacter sp.]|jgi:putative selenium metabolism hydrolase|nr:YgeY family selenium metabolism-linked hydrolase [Accumulibacter sp.]
MLTPEIQDAVTELCRALIAAESYSGRENKAASVLRLYMESHGFDEVFVDEYGSVTGTIQGKRSGPRLLLDGHIDTVPVPDASVWHYPPFAGRIENGRLYGRGASDMKGAVAAMTVAASLFSAATRRNFPGTLCVAGVVHEECFEGVAARKISARLRPDIVVIGEASDLNLKIGQRGRAEIVAETYGVPAHSSNPQKGINAVLSMLCLAGAIDALAPPRHPVLGPGLAVLTDIISSPYPGASVVPDHCRATYDRRLLVGETRESVLAPFQEAIESCEKKDLSFRGRVSLAKGRENCYTGAVIEGERFFPGWLFDEKEAFIQQALAGLQAIGLHPEITHYSFCTNASHYAGEKNIKTLGFGPSPENLAHTLDEYIALEQLYAATEGYVALCGALLKE